MQETTCSADLGSIPLSGRSPGEGNGDPYQYSYLEKPKDRGAWQATVYGVAKSDTTYRLDHHRGCQKVASSGLRKAKG